LQSAKGTKFGPAEKKNAASNEPPQREAKILEFQCSSARQDEKKSALHSAMQKFHANQASSKKFGTRDSNSAQHSHSSAR